MNHKQARDSIFGIIITVCVLASALGYTSYEWQKKIGTDPIPFTDDQLVLMYDFLSSLDDYQRMQLYVMIINDAESNDRHLTKMEKFILVTILELSPPEKTRLKYGDKLGV